MRGQSQAIAAVAAGFCLGGPASSAQNQIEPQLETVVVTAQRREEPLQRVPIAASVLSSEQIEAARLVDVDSLQYAVPNLTNAPGNVSRTVLNMGMRGQFNRDSAASVDPAVGVYLDEVYLGRMVGANVLTEDLARVEVLRGPQGTLFGRNTIGGAINLVSRKPGEALSGKLRATIGDFSRAEMSGAIDLPWSEGRHALRLTTALHERHGFAQTTQRMPLDDEHLRFARIQYRTALRPSWDLNVAVDYTRSSAGAQRRTLLAVTSAGASLPANFGNPSDRLDRYIDPYSKWLPIDAASPVLTRLGGASAVMSVKWHDVSFKSISSYRFTDSLAQATDSDGGPYDLARVAYRQDDQRQFSQELQAFGTAAGERFDWIGGAHFFEEHGNFRQRVRTYVPAIHNWNESIPDGVVRNRASAAYVQASFALDPNWRVFAGARHNLEGRQLTSFNTAVVNGVFGCRLSIAVRDQPNLCRASLPERQFSFTPWTLGLSFNNGDKDFYYLKIDRGFRSGGYNIRGVGVLDLTTFEPERVTTVEFGARVGWQDGKMRASLALFRSRFDAIQVAQRDPTPPQPSVIRNGGTARIEGGELETSAMLGRTRLALSLGVVRAAFTRLAPEVQEVTLSSKFHNTPRHTASMSLDTPLTTQIGEFKLHADYSWRDDVWFEYSPQSLARQDAFGLLNMQLTLRHSKSPLEFSIWARNLANQRYMMRAFEGEYFLTAVPGDPRTLGLSVSYRFGAER